MILLALFFVFFVPNFAQPPDPPLPDVYWFNQRFDHFNPSDNRTFKQRFLVYEGFWNTDGPIFFCPGGESDVFGGYNHNGFMFALGEILGAFLLFPEHRFYGNSLPFGPVDSYNADNIRSLTIEAALIDYINIIDYVKKEWDIPETAPLISFGGSYPAELTIYLRIAFPNFIDAGLASSAPILFHAGKVPGGAFFQVVTEDFAEKDPLCPNLVRKAFSEILQTVKTDAGREDISKRLKLCDTIQDDGPAVRLVALWIENAFATLGMENYPYPFEGFPPNPMIASCEIMKNSGPDLVYALGQAAGIAYNTTKDLKCFNITEEYYPCADITGCGGGVGDPEALSWDYQSCTEIVSPVDTNNVTDMFPSAPFSFDALTSYCKKTWGVIPNPNYISTKYPFLNSTRLIFSNGYLDPWYPGGIFPQDCPQGKEYYCLLIKHAAHHLDLRGNDPNDPDEVVYAREVEADIIIDWVQTIKAEKTQKLMKQGLLV